MGTDEIKRSKPTLTSIDDPIAEDRWEYEDERGVTKTVRIVVGRPTALPEKDWYTPIAIEGFTPGITLAYGVGPADSLMNAMVLAKAAFDRIHRLPREGREPVASAMEWITDWYRRQCDGTWEHERGLVIQTLDNPGWLLKVNLVGTDLKRAAGRDSLISSFGTNEQGHPISPNWFHSQIRGSQYVAAGDASQLPYLFTAFRAWAMSVAAEEQG